MARLQHGDRELGARLDKLESRMMQLKILYEKYFSGLEKIEPVKERDEVRLIVKDLTLEFFPSLMQRHRFQMLKARYISLDQYIARNLFLIERGTHPRFLFRANLADARRTGEAGPRPATPRVSDFERQRQREEAAYKQVFDKYMEARRACGQEGELDFATVRDNLRKQVKLIKSRFRCESVKFRIAVENGRATLKAVPMQVQAPPPPSPGS